MSVSKNRKEHKQKLNKRKTNQKNMSNQEKNVAMPPVRTIPTWNPEANITLKGFEWEAIQNGLGSLQLSMQAAQSVMSRNIIDGNIQMDFEKLNNATMQYEPMTEEEKAPHRKAFDEQIAAFKEAQKSGQGLQKGVVEQADESQVQSEPEQESGLVNVHGEALTAENVGQAKIITMD